MRLPRTPHAVGAENACHLGICAEETVGSSAHAWRLVAGLGRPGDDFRLVGLKLIFLIVTRAVSVLGLSRREAWRKDAEILMLRHQLAVALRERPRTRYALLRSRRVRLLWSDLPSLPDLHLHRDAGARMTPRPAA